MVSLYKRTVCSTPVPIILKRPFIRERGQMMAKFTTMNWLQKPVVEIKET